MRKLLTVIVAIIAMFVPAMCVAESGKDVGTVRGSQSVGLVLSGGGAKGIAHIGVIRALEDADIPIDYVCGTSMGAIVGGLYSAGYTTDEMLDLILSKGFSYWSTGKIDPSLCYNFTMPEPTPALFSFNVGGKADSIQNAVPASLISPIPMNFAFMELFAGFTAQTGGDFDSLMVPFRCVASDVAAHRKVVLGHGSLGDAIRSSMSFPAVFQPTKFDGMLLYDGGIYDNFPVDVMRSTFAPDVMIGVDVSSSDSGPQTSLFDQIENLVVQNADYSLPAEEGVKIKVDVDQFGLLDFPRAREIYRIGYDKAMSMIDSIKGRIQTRMPAEARKLRREVFKSQTPFLRFDSVSVTGATRGQNEYIKHLFELQEGDTINVADARESFYKAVSSGKLRDLGVQARYNSGNGLFALDLDASVKDDFRLGIGGWITSSANSYIYLSGGYSRLSFNSLSANVDAWIGQSYMAATVNGRMHTRLAGVAGSVQPQALQRERPILFRGRYPHLCTQLSVFRQAAPKRPCRPLGSGGARMRLRPSVRQFLSADSRSRIPQRARPSLSQSWAGLSALYSQYAQLAQLSGERLQLQYVADGADGPLPYGQRLVAALRSQRQDTALGSAEPASASLSGIAATLVAGLRERYNAFYPRTIPRQLRGIGDKRSAIHPHAVEL